MKKIAFGIVAVLSIFLMVSCSSEPENPIDDIVISDVEQATVPESEAASDEESPKAVNTSKFIEYLGYITNNAPAAQLSYLLESTYTLNGLTVSKVCAVSDGKILNIASNGEVTTAEIYTPETLTLLDCNAKTYTQSPMEPSVYEQAVSSLEYVAKYEGIDFTPSGYTVVDKDCYAEVAVINGITKIFVFDDTSNLKYIIYAMDDGALVTEEIISFAPGAELIKPEDFIVPSDFSLIQPVE